MVTTQQIRRARENVTEAVEEAVVQTTHEVGNSDISAFKVALSQYVTRANKLYERLQETLKPLGLTFNAIYSEAYHEDWSRIDFIEDRYTPANEDHKVWMHVYDDLVKHCNELLSDIDINTALIVGLCNYLSEEVPDWILMDQST